jgi:hypothetical protein
VCDRLCIAGSVSANTLVSQIVDDFVDELLNSAIMAPFFDGSAPGAKNFTDPINSKLLLTLKSHLVEFLADESLMGCTDGSIPAYSGVSLGQAHQNLFIGETDVQVFNTILLDILGNNGFNANEIAAITDRLTILGKGVCNLSECSVPPIFPDEVNAASSFTFSVLVLLFALFALLL